MKRCMYCGNENDDSSLNCSKCGNRLLDIPTESPVPVMDVEVPEVGPILAEAEAAVQEAQEQADEAQEQVNEALEQAQEAIAQAEAIETPAEEILPNAKDAEPYAARPDVPYEEAFQQGYPYAAQQGFADQPEVQQQYGGQAYGYQGEVQQFGYQGQAQTQGNYTYGKTQEQMNAGARDILVKARRAVKSPLFFFVVLLHTIMTVAAVLNLVTGNAMINLNMTQEYIERAMPSNLAVSYMNTAIDLLQKADKLKLIGAELLISLPGILICLGLWLMFLKTKRTNERISTAGYTLTRVMVLLKFIVLCLILTAGLILTVAYVVTAGASGKLVPIIAGIVMLLVMILVSSLTILFYVQLLHCLRVIKHNAKTGANPGRISTYIPVMGILMAIGTGLSMLPMAPNDYLGLIGQASSAAWLLFASIWVLVYRVKVRR